MFANLHAYFHVGQVSKWHFSGHQLPQQDGKAPHVSWPTVDLFWLLLQGWEPQNKAANEAYTVNWRTCLWLLNILQLIKNSTRIVFLNQSWLWLQHTQNRKKNDRGRAGEQKQERALNSLFLFKFLSGHISHYSSSAFFLPWCTLILLWRGKHRLIWSHDLFLWLQNPIFMPQAH